MELHKWVKDDTIKVKLMKMSKGYQWEITYEHENLDICLARIKEADSKLLNHYGPFIIDTPSG